MLLHGDVELLRVECSDCIPASEMLQRHLPAFGMYREDSTTGLVYRVGICTIKEFKLPSLNDSCRCSRPYTADDKCGSVTSESSIGKAPFLFAVYGVWLPIYLYLITSACILLHTKWVQSGVNMKKAKSRRGRHRSQNRDNNLCSKIKSRWNTVMTTITLILAGLILRALSFFLDPFSIFHWVQPTLLNTWLQVSTSLFFSSGLLLTKCFVNSVNFVLHFNRTADGFRCLDFYIYSSCFLLMAYSLTTIVVNSPGMEYPARIWDEYQTLVDAGISILLVTLFLYWGVKAVHMLSGNFSSPKVKAKPPNDNIVGHSKWTKLRYALKFTAALNIAKKNANETSFSKQRRGLVQTWIRHIFRAALFIFLNFITIAIYSLGKQGNDPLSFYVLNQIIRLLVILAVYSMLRIAEGLEVSKISPGRLLRLFFHYGRLRLGCRDSFNNTKAIDSSPVESKVATSLAATKHVDVIIEEVNSLDLVDDTTISQTKQDQVNRDGTPTFATRKSMNDLYCENPDGFVDAETGKRYWKCADGRISWTNPRNSIIDTSNPMK